VDGAGPGARPSGRRTLRLAHRGDHRRHPENSLAALVAALDVPGCDGVEFDVRASRDGVPVVIHDDTLARVQGRPEAVGQLSAGELEALGIPRLEDVLATLPHRAFLDVEIKESFGRTLVEVLAAGRGPDLHNAVVSAFDPGAIARVRSLAPSWPCWLNSDDLGPAAIRAAVHLGCAGIAVEWHALDADAVAGARAEGLDVAAWTVIQRSARTRLIKLGIAAICVEGAALEG
jgi:glycerophosphoryl diester phosphodiesterase